MARKEQAANEVQQVVVIENVPAVNATSFQQVDGGNVENKEDQDQNRVTNQETTVASSTIDVVASHTSEPKSEEATQNPECKTSMLKF